MAVHSRLDKKIGFIMERFVIAAGFIFFLFGTVSAQDGFDQISTSPTSEGDGYVVRFHTAATPDSFSVRQPTSDLVQLSIHGKQIDTSGVYVPDLEKPFDDITLHPIPNGVGVDVYLNQDFKLAASAYPDGRSSHLLLGLKKTTSQHLRQITDNVSSIIWSRYVSSQKAGMENDPLHIERQNNSEEEIQLSDTYHKAKNKLKFDVVVIDPGHGGRDPGSIGYKNTKEKKITLDVALKLGEYINKYLPEVKVVYTRKTDKFVGLEERGHIANEAEGDLFVSLHCNAFRSRHINGSEVYFLGLHKSESAFKVMKQENSVIKLEEGRQDKKSRLTENELLIYELANSGYMATSEKIAGMVEHQFDHRAKRHSRGVKQAGFIVLYHASMPAILTELGFISNPSEQRFLTSDYGKSIMASALFRAIRNYKEEYEKSQNLTSN